ncbi:MAG: helix-turn-helix transcriptional regulator [Clostridia bacterium]|nr:helix-turn-helix transcriptional regulator [Clostridia bacterium]
MNLRIKDMREDNDLTQKQIAEILLCDQSLYSKYERREREIPLAMIVKLAEYYEVSVDYLIGRTENPKINK